VSPSSIVYKEDCTAGMKRFPDGHFDLAICDIPYGIGVAKMAYTRETSKVIRQKNGSTLKVRPTPYVQKDWDSATPDQAYFNELRRVSRHQIIFGIEYVQWEGVGPGRIKWNKGVPEGVSFNSYEVAYCSLIEGEMELPLLWSGMQQAMNLSNPMTPQGNKALNEKRVHPCHKPVLLYKALLKEFGGGKKRLLDTHLGGGSSRLAAYEMGYDFTAFEIDEDYYEAQEKRFLAATAQQYLFNPNQ
jgi:site-specific DNA-methyltransferase (adenine-specific)